jgi:hypothetical protein
MKMRAFPLSTIFEKVKLGDFHVSGDLDAGNVDLAPENCASCN